MAGEHEGVNVSSCKKGKTVDHLFSINTPNRVIDVNSVGDAVASFEATGTIATGSIKYLLSTDGITFNPVSYFSFVALAMRSEVSPAQGFAGTERGSIDIINTQALRIVSSPDFQGNIRLSVCEVLDAPTPPDNKCCPSPTVFKSFALREGTGDVWTPTPGSRFVLMGYSLSVTADAQIHPSGGVEKLSLMDGANPIGTDAWVWLPGAGPAGDEPVYNGPWIDLGDGYHAASPNTPLRLQASVALTQGLVFVNIAGREE